MDDASWREESIAWRREREDALRAPWGWLSVAGLHWLVDGEQDVEGQRFTLADGELWHGERQLEPLDEVTLGDHAKLVVIARSGRLALRVKDNSSALRREFAGCKWHKRAFAVAVTYWIALTFRQLTVRGALERA